MNAALQLYTLRTYGDSAADRVELAGEAGFDAVEFASLPDEDEVENVSLALAAGDLGVAAAHVDVETLETEPDVVADRLGELDCDRVVAPSLPEAAFATPASVDETAHRLTTLSEELSAYGFDLSYHNHDHEFRSIRRSDERNGERSESDGTDEWTAFDRLLRETDDHVGIELDVGLAAVGGADPIALLERVPGRIGPVHVKDVSEGASVQLGEGRVDLDACVGAAREAGVEWAAYERDDPDAPESAIEEGHAELEGLLERPE